VRARSATLSEGLSRLSPFHLRRGKKVTVSPASGSLVWCVWCICELHNAPDRRAQGVRDGGEKAGVMVALRRNS